MRNKTASAFCKNTMMGLLGSIIVFFCISLGACTSEVEDDLYLANEAFDRYDISDAEMHYERFLRKNPDSPNRWWVWNRLLDIALNMRQQKAAAIAYLEIMQEEYRNDDNKRRNIMRSLAELYFEVHNHERSVILWEEVVNDSSALPKEKAEALRKLAFLYLRRLDFSDSTRALQFCLNLDVEQEVKAGCLFDLAEIQLLLGELPQAYANLHTLLQLDDSNNERYLLVRFMYADVLEQQGKFNEALDLFKQLRSQYPNPAVIEVRIQSLQQRLAKK